MRLPSGQDVARAMGVTPLTDDKILIGKFTGDKADIISSQPSTKLAMGKGSSAIVPSGRTCWRRLSVSADTLKTLQGDKKIISRRLGPVGGRRNVRGSAAGGFQLVCELNPLWKPTLAINGVFGLRELIQRALEG